MTTYKLSMRDESGSEHTATFDAEPTLDMINESCEGWVSEGDWGEEGGAVSVWWTLTEENDEFTTIVDKGSIFINIEPNHAILIRRAMRWRDSCGDEPQDHDWTSEGEGGCTENPGVWSVGGTALVFASHCTRCGLHRRIRTTGPQRNPGEYDTVEYSCPIG